MNARDGAGERAASGVLFADVSFEGRRYALALVRTFWADEGSCVFEALSVPGDASVAVEFGSWHLKSTDRGPATLCVDVAIPSDLTPHNDELLGKLLDVALMRGAAWGIEARESLGAS